MILRVSEVPPTETATVFHEMANAVGFDAADERQLLELSTWLEPHFPRVVDEFYRVLLANKEMASLFEDEHQVARQKSSLRN